MLSIWTVAEPAFLRKNWANVTIELDGVTCVGFDRACRDQDQGKELESHADRGEVGAVGVEACSLTHPARARSWQKCSMGESVKEAGIVFVFESCDTGLGISSNLSGR